MLWWNIQDKMYHLTYPYNAGVALSTCTSLTFIMQEWRWAHSHHYTVITMMQLQNFYPFPKANSIPAITLHSLPSHSWQPPTILSVSINLTTLGPAYKSDHMIFCVFGLSSLGQCLQGSTYWGTQKERWGTTHQHFLPWGVCILTFFLFVKLYLQWGSRGFLDIYEQR